MYDHISIGRTFFDCAIAAWAEWARPALAKLTHQNRATCSLRIPVYLPRPVGGLSFCCEQQFMHLVVHLHPLVLWFNPRLDTSDRLMDVCVQGPSIDRPWNQPRWQVYRLCHVFVVFCSCFSFLVKQTSLPHTRRKHKIIDKVWTPSF